MSDIHREVLAKLKQMREENVPPTIDCLYCFGNGFTWSPRIFRIGRERITCMACGGSGVVKQ